MAKQSSGKERVFIWAVDPFISEKKLLEDTAQAIGSLTKKLPALIQPVYCWNNLAQGMPFGGINELIPEIRTSGQDNLDTIIQRTGLTGVLPLRVLAKPYYSKHLEARYLVNFSINNNAEMLIVSTRSRTGPKHWILGSFAETLMLVSDIPLFVVNPSWKATSHFDHVLFPTDFSERSRKAFPKVIEFTKSLQANLTLFHKAQLPFYVPDPVLGTLIVPPEEVQKQFEEGLREEGRKLAKRAEELGVSCDVVIDFESTQPIAEAILEFAEKTPGIIAMASQSGRFGQIFIGSTTRKVSRASSDPVWIIHPEVEKKRSKLSGRIKKKKDDLFTIEDDEIIEELQSHRKISKGPKAA